jgi:hypothetical protein
MAKTFRLSDDEEEAIRKKCIEINKVLVKEGRQPLKDSELLHRIIEKAIGMAEVSNSGEITIKE